MNGPRTEVPALQETAPNVQFIQGRGRASEGKVNNLTGDGESMNIYEH
jgi:hypothetical protein